jgi:hypothetical protein
MTFVVDEHSEEIRRRNWTMATKYHSLKLFRLLIGDVSQVRFAGMIGFDAAHVSRIEAGYRANSVRMCEALRALLHPYASRDDVEALLSGEMSVEDVHRLAQVYAMAKEWRPDGPDARGPVGGSSDGNEGTNVVGAPAVCAPTQPAGNCPAVQNDAGAGQQGGTRASA